MALDPITFEEKDEDEQQYGLQELKDNQDSGKYFGIDAKTNIDDNNYENFLRKVADTYPTAPRFDEDAVGLHFYAKHRLGKYYNMPKDVPDWARKDTDTPQYKSTAEYNENKKKEPSYFWDAVGSGGNWSVTGLSKQIITGDGLWDVSDEYSPDLFQSTIEFISGLAHDIPFFLLTGGLGLTTAVAGAPAKQMAVRTLGRVFFKDGVKKSVWKGVTQKQVRKIATQKIRKEDLYLALKKNLSDPTDLAQLERLYGESAKSANKHILKQLTIDGKGKTLRQEFMEAGYKQKFGKESVEIGAPGLRRLFHAGGRPMATQLGLHAASGNILGQIQHNISEATNPETGQKYGDEDAKWLWDRWAATGEAIKGIDMTDVVMSSMEGYIGGYLAGGFGMLGKAHRMGALNKKDNYNRFMKNSNHYGRQVVNTLGHKYLDLPIEAGIFTSVHTAGRMAREGLGIAPMLPPGEKHDTWWESWGKNMLQFGAMRKINGAKAAAKRHIQTAKTEFVGAMSAGKLKQKGLLDKIENKEITSEQERITNEELLRSRKERIDAVDKIEAKGVDKYDRINELFNKKETLGLEQLAELESLVNNFKKDIIDSQLEYKNTLGSATVKMNEKVQFIKEQIPILKEEIAETIQRHQDYELSKSEEQIASQRTNKQTNKPLTEDTLNQALDYHMGGGKAYDSIVKSSRETLNLTKNKTIREKVFEQKTGNDINHTANMEVLSVFAAKGSPSQRLNINFIRDFAIWLGNNHGMNLRNFTKAEAQQYINEMGYGFTSREKIRNFVKFAQGKDVDANQTKLMETDINMAGRGIFKDSPKHQKRKQVTLSVSELLNFDQKANLNSHSNSPEFTGRAGTMEIAGTTGINKANTMSVKNTALRLITHLLGHFGTRKTGIVGGKDVSGERTIEHIGIKLKDVYKEQGPGGVEYFVLKLREKGWENDPTKIKRIAVENKAEINGENYFKDLEILFAERMRKAEKELGTGPGKSDLAGELPLFETYTSSKKNGRPTNAADIDKIVERYVGKEGFTPHKFRHTLLQLAEKLDQRIEGAGGQRKWRKFVSEYLISHTPKKSLDAQSDVSYIGDAQKMDVLQVNEMRRAFFKELSKNKDIVVDKKTTRLIDETFKKQGEEASGDSAPTAQGFKPSPKKQLIRNKKGQILTDEQLVEMIKEEAVKNPGIKIKKIDDGKGNYAAQIIRGTVEVVTGKATVESFIHENVHRLEAFSKASGDKSMSKLFDRGIKLAKEFGKKNDAEYQGLIDAYRRDITLERRRDGKRPFTEKEMQKEIHREYLTEMSAHWGGKWRTHTGLKKLKLWGNLVFSKIKAYFGKAGFNDIAHIYGYKAQKGFSTLTSNKEILKNLEAIWKDPQKQLDLEANDPITRDTRKNIETEMKRLDLDEGGFEAVKVFAGANKKLTVSALSEAEGSSILNILRNVKISESGTVKRSPAWKSLVYKAKLAENLAQIIPRVKNQIGKAIGLVPNADGNVSLRTASKQQLKSYMAWIKNYKEHTPQKRLFSDEAVMDLVNNNPKQWSKWKFVAGMALLPVDAVLRKFLPKFKTKDKKGNVVEYDMGAVLSDKLLDHFQTEAAYFGYGQWKIQKAMKGATQWAREYGLAGNLPGQTGKVLDLFGYALDPALAKGVKFSAKETQFLKDAKRKGTTAYTAVNEIRDLYKYYYQAMYKEASKVLGAKDFETFKQEFNEKYVTNYYTRQFTDKAIEHFNIGGKGHEKFQQSIKAEMADRRLNAKYGSKIKELKQRIIDNPTMSGSTRKILNEKIKQLELRKAKEQQELMNVETAAGEALHLEASRTIFHLLNKPNFRLKNRYLLERMAKQDNTFVDEFGKTHKTYEMNFEKVLGRYIRIMSGQLATIEHFNEFNPLGIRGKHSTEKTMDDMLVLLQKRSIAGQYAVDAIKSRIGLNGMNALQETTVAVANKLGKGSAFLGLSSPMSGLKNFAIGSVMTFGTFGSLPFLKGIFRSLDADAREYVTKIGGKEVGTKELELTGKGKWWMDNISFMTRSEAINRFIAVYAGRQTAQQLANVLGGKGKVLFKNLRETNAIQKGKELFNWTEADIQFIRNYGLIQGKHGLKGRSGKIIDAEISRIMDKVSHYSHIKTQGATAESFLPLWAQGKHTKALTLFYRMAYSGTYNIWNNILKPAKRGDLFPMMRYGLAGNLAGAGMWELYSYLFGQENPKALSDSTLDKVFANFSKVETLGLLSFMVSPYKQSGLGVETLFGAGDQIMQPAILKNVAALADITLYSINTGAKLIGMNDNWHQDKALLPKFEDTLKNTFVAFNHLHRNRTKRWNERKVDYNHINTLKQEWYKSSGWAKREGTSSFEYSHERQKYYQYIKESFWSGDYESTARYLEATRFYLYDQIRFQAGDIQTTHLYAKRAADRQLASIIRSLNPINLSTNIEGRDAKYYQFMDYLKKDPKVYEMAVKLEREYYYNFRQLNKKREEYYKKYAAQYWDEGKVFWDGLIAPPTGKFLLNQYTSKDLKKWSNLSKTAYGKSIIKKNRS